MRIEPLEFTLRTNRGQQITGVTAACCRSGLRALSGDIKKDWLGLAGKHAIFRRHLCNTVQKRL